MKAVLLLLLRRFNLIFLFQVIKVQFLTRALWNNVLCKAPSCSFKILALLWNSNREKADLWNLCVIIFSLSIRESIKSCFIISVYLVTKGKGLLLNWFFGVVQLILLPILSNGRTGIMLLIWHFVIVPQVHWRREGTIYSLVIRDLKMWNPKVLARVEI